MKRSRLARAQLGVPVVRALVSPAGFFSGRRLDELIEKRCNHYRQIMGCMLSRSRRVRPVIVNCSTANRHHLSAPITRTSFSGSYPTSGIIRHDSRRARASKGPHPISARNRVDQPTIRGRTCANLGYYKPLFACVDRAFSNQFIAAGACNFFRPVASGGLHYSEPWLL